MSRNKHPHRPSVKIPEWVLYLEKDKNLPKLDCYGSRKKTNYARICRGRLLVDRSEFNILEKDPNYFINRSKYLKQVLTDYNKIK